VAIFSVVRARIHVGSHYVIKLHLLVFLINCMYVINAHNEHGTYQFVLSFWMDSFFYVSLLSHAEPFNSYPNINMMHICVKETRFLVTCIQTNIQI
jgi:hypothetical protein